MNTQIFRILAALFLSVSVLAAGFGQADAAQRVELPSGSVIIVESVGKGYFAGEGAWALVLNYQSEIPLSNTAGLRAEAKEIWRHFLGRMAEQAEVMDAVVVASEELASSILGIAKTKKTHAFVFTRDEGGGWKITKPDEYMSAKLKDGLDYLRAGRAAQRQGNHAEAVMLYTKALEAGDLPLRERVRALNGRCWAYNEVGERAQLAINDCVAALELNSDSAAAHLNLGNALIRSGNHYGAIREYTEVIRLQPDYAAAYSNRGAVYDDIGEHDQALEDFARGLQIDPGAAFLYNNRCDSHLGSGDYHLALADCNKAVELAREGRSPALLATSYFTRGEVAEAMGNRNAAAEDYLKAYELFPDNPTFKAKAAELGFTS
jgi:tetratricopeptide (TPR) repeat protein